MNTPKNYDHLFKTSQYFDKPGNKVAVVGSRTFQSYSRLKVILNSFKDVKLIISGGAKGADELSQKYADEHNVKTLIFLPEWNKYGKAAGPIRNRKIVENCDILVAFWDGESKGLHRSK